MDPKKEGQKQLADELWYWYLTGEHKHGFPKNYERLKSVNRAIYGILPGDTRCFECNLPLSGAGANVVGSLGMRPSQFSPQLCGWCEASIRKMEGGAEVELTMLFADVRGSTELAESKDISNFTALIQRFYKISTQIILDNSGMVKRLMGDQVIGLFLPRFSGEKHAGSAIRAARELLVSTGNQDEIGPWAPIGISIHSGPAYVGTVGSGESVNEIAVLGNDANLTARLSSEASQGEVLISQEAMHRIEQREAGLELRSLNLKGISSPISAWVMNVGSKSEIMN